MLQFILRRLLHAVPLLLAVVVLNFLLIALTPGDPITLLVGDFPAPPEYLEKMRAEKQTQLAAMQALNTLPMDNTN